MSSGRDLSLHARARTAHRLAARQPAGGARIPLARHRRPARSGPYHRARQHRQSRSRARAQPRSHPGCAKRAGRKLAEAGCTAHEIMGILGHTSLKEAERYTKDFNRAKLARSGIARLGNETVTRKAKNYRARMSALGANRTRRDGGNAE